MQQASTQSRTSAQGQTAPTSYHDDDDNDYRNGGEGDGDGGDLDNVIATLDIQVLKCNGVSP